MKTPQPFWKHWNLKRNPFGPIESQDDVFESAEMGRIMEHLSEAVEEGGIYSVTGERGIGKTSAKNEIIAYFRENAHRFAYSVLECMDMGMVNMGAIHSAIIYDLSNEAPKRSGESRARQVRRILGELAAQRKIVLIIDEAQKLNMATLERLKMLTEMTWALRTRLVTVLLFGQPELVWRISRDEGLMMRVTQYRMSGFTVDETLQYIDQRCRAAGGKMEEIFAPDALVYIAENQHSPLHINHVCSTAMRMARRAGDARVTLAMIFACGGIRTPREVLRDNKITVRAFARICKIHEDAATKLLNGETVDTSEEQQARFRDGLGKLMRGKNQEIEEVQEPAGVAAAG